MQYERVQFLDADLLPSINMDMLFTLPFDYDLVSCPDKVSVLNAGWFLLRPSCEHFRRMVKILKKGFDVIKGWGHPLQNWSNTFRQNKKTTWNFFDANGNQGLMYSYFRFDARSMCLIYTDRVVSLDSDMAEHVIATRDHHALHPRGSSDVWSMYPCPLPVKAANGVHPLHRVDKAMGREE